MKPQNLDLIVTSPTGTVYRGNVFSGGWTQTADSADRTNNVEHVYVQSAGSGTWTVAVRGAIRSDPEPRSGRRQQRHDDYGE